MNKKAIFKKGSPKVEPVEVSGFKEPFLVRGLSARQRVAMFSDLFEGGNIKEGRFFPAELLARCVVDEDGKRIFEDEDVTEIGDMSEDFIMPLFEAAQRLNGLGAEDDEVKN